MSDLFVTATPRSLGVLPVGALLLGGTGVSEQADGGPSIAPLPRAAEPMPVRPRGQAGLGLIEVMISLLFVSMVVLAIAAGLLLVIQTNSSNSERQSAQLLLGNYAESLKGMDYVPCAQDDDYSPLGDPTAWQPPTGVTAEIESISYWKKTTGVDGPGAFDLDCTSPENDDGAQKLSIMVELGDRQVRTELVKARR